MRNKVSTQLLCTFTYKGKLEDTLQQIREHYRIAFGKIFVLKNEEDPDELFCTYNIETDGGNVRQLSKTISIHRKKQTNTLYTINALNKLIVELNDGILDKSYSIPWEDYQNTLLVTNGELIKEINTTLYDIVDIERNQI